MAFIQSRNGIVLFTLVTALGHLFLGVRSLGDGFFGPLFILNGVGFLALLYATYWTPSFLKGQAALVRWAYLAMAAATFILYFVFNGAGSFSSESIPALVIKLAELLLFLGLWKSK